MKWLTDLSIRHPLITLVAVVAVTVGFGWGLKHLEADSDVLRDLPENMPEKVMYDRIGELFPSKEMVFVGVESDQLWTAEGLRQLAVLTQAIEDVPVVQQVISPTNATVAVGTAEGMEIRDAAEPFPGTDAEAIALRDFLLAQEATRGTVISEDGKVAAMMVFLQARLATTESKAAGQVSDAIDASHGDLTVYPAGRPMVTYISSKKIGKETGMLSSAALLLMTVLLFLLFMNLRGVILPLGVVIASVLCSMGAMGWAGIAMTHSMEALPILLIAVGVADGVHIVQAYMARAREATDRRDAARLTMDDLRRPVIMTSVTTAVGFLALNTSGARSIMLLGLVTAFGVFMAMIFSLTLVPAILALLPVPKRARDADVQKRGYRLQRLMVGYGDALFQHKRLAATAVVIFVVLCGVGATFVEVETSILKNFREDDPIRISSEFFNDHFAGVTNLQVVFEGPGENALKDPELLKRIEEFEAWVAELPDVGGSTSILPMLRSMNRVLHADDPAYDRLPGALETEHGFDYEVDEEGNEIKVPVTYEVTGREIVAGYFSLLEMSGKPGDLSNFVTDDYRSAKVTVFLKTDARQDVDRIVSEIRSYMDGYTDQAKVEMTGMAVLMLAVDKLITRGQGLSILVSLFLVFVVTALMFRSLVLGVANVVPLFAAIFFNFGLMGLLGIDLNLMTMAVSSMAIGVGVDFAIHFVHRYRVSMAEAGEPREALRLTMEEAGVAILMNMVAVAGGFLTLLMASFKGVMTMGLLISLIMVFSAIGALTILPLLFTGLKLKALEKPGPIVALLAASALGLGLLAAPAPAHAGDDAPASDPEALAFMTEVLDRGAFDSMTGKSTLTLTAANGTSRLRVFDLASRKNAEGETDMIMSMVEPADMRGNGFLMLGHAQRDDDRYIYVPALRRSNRIVGAGRGGAFMSSEFSIDDIGRPEIDEWAWSFDGEAEVDGVVCKKVVGTAISAKVAKDTGYASVVWYVDPTLKTSRKAEYHDRQGVLFKRMEVLVLEELGGVPFATDMQMTNLGTGRSSRMQMEGLVINEEIDAGWFTERTLSKGLELAR
jgi:uncharacterized protein